MAKRRKCEFNEAGKSIALSVSKRPVGGVCSSSRFGKHFPLNPVCIYNQRGTFSHQTGCFSHIRLIVKFYICQHSWLGKILNCALNDCSNWRSLITIGRPL